MKTDKETQLKIIKQVQEDLSKGRHYLYSIEWFQIYSGEDGEWTIPRYIDFKNVEYRVRPDTIKLNGKYIPRPLTKVELSELDDTPDSYVYVPYPLGYLYSKVSRSSAKDQFYEGMLIYKTSKEAIEASKLVFNLQ